METTEILRRIAIAPGVSGTESATADAIEKIMKPLSDNIRRDALGNLICEINPGKEKSIMLIAHMDKIGLSVTGIDKKSGFLRVAKCGGTDIRTLSAARVKVYGKKTLDGVVISVPPHLADKKTDNTATPIDKTAVDCGLPYEEIIELVSAGDRIEIRLPFTPLLGTKVTSPYIDDTAGCTAIIKAVEEIKDKDIPYTVYAVFSTREEVGKQGAKTAAFGVEPDEAIVTDVSFAVQKGVGEEEGAPLGSGAMIGYAALLQKSMSDELKAAAKNKNIPFTTEVMGRTTGTDADVVTVTKKGVVTGLVSIPIRYMHTPVETVDIKDIEAVASVMAEYIMR